MTLALSALHDRKASARDERDSGGSAWLPTVLISMVHVRLHSLLTALVS